MKFLIISAFLIACVLSVPRGWQWTPIGLNTRTALGAYHHVQREYEGRLRMGRFLLAYRRVCLCFSIFMRKPVLEGSDLVRHDTGRLAAADGLAFEIFEIVQYRQRKTKALKRLNFS